MKPAPDAPPPAAAEAEADAPQAPTPTPCPAEPRSNASTAKPQHASASSTSAPGHPLPLVYEGGGGNPDCSLCHGSGYLRCDLPVDHPDFGKLHHCPDCAHLTEEERLKKTYAAKQRRIEAYTVTRPEQTFDTFDARTVAPAIREAYHIARRFAEAPSGWLVLHGNPGTGKSHLAGAIVNRCRDTLALSLVMPDLLELLRSGFDDDSYGEVLGFCRDVRLLVLDDMGTESPTPWAQEKLFQILNHRYNHRLPTVLVFNGAIDDFEPRIASRMTDSALSTVVSVYGEDYRRRSSG